MTRERKLVSGQRHSSRHRESTNLQWQSEVLDEWRARRRSSVHQSDWYRETPMCLRIWRGVRPVGGSAHLDDLSACRTCAFGSGNMESMRWRHLDRYWRIATTCSAIPNYNSSPSWVSEEPERPTYILSNPLYIQRSSCLTTFVLLSPNSPPYSSPNNTDLLTHPLPDCASRSARRWFRLDPSMKQHGRTARKGSLRCLDE